MWPWSHSLLPYVLMGGERRTQCIVRCCQQGPHLPGYYLWMVGLDCGFSSWLCMCRRAIAVALQTGVANQIHSAGTPLALATDVSYVVRTPQNNEDTEMLDDPDFENTQDVNVSPGSQIGYPGNAVVVGGG